MKRYLGFFTLLAALATSATAQVNMAAWSGFKAYRINTSTATGIGLAAAGGGNVLKFPLLIRLTAADSNVFAQAKTGGADIRFTKSDLSAVLPHQIERWDSAGRNAAIWVLIDTVYTNNNTRTTRMYWGNAAASDVSNGPAVFDTTNGYVGVWHMSATGATETELDNTANGFNAIVDNSVSTGNSPTSTTEATIGLARQFGGGSTTVSSVNRDFLRVQNSASGKLNFPSNGRYSQSAWVRPTTTGGNRGIISKHDRKYNLKFTGTGSNWEVVEYNNNRGVIMGMDTATPFSWQGASAPATNNTWVHLVGVRDSLALRLYVNGVLAATNTGTDSASYPTAGSTNPVVEDSAVYIGKPPEQASSRYFAGQIDEVRIYNRVLSANYIRLSYETQRTGQTTVNALTPPTIAYTQDTLTVEAGLVINPVGPSLVSGFPALTYAVSPALPAGLILSTTTGVISGTPTTTGNTKHGITATNSEGTSTDSIRIIVTAPAEANYSAWTGTKTLNFSTTAAGAGVTSAQSLFPLLVRLTPSADSLVFVQAKAGGADIRFSRANGTRLRYQIDHWDATTRNAAIWVQMDNVTPSAVNEVRLHWGNTAANSMSDGNSVFSAANGFAAVWHLGNAADTSARPNAVAGGPAAVPMRFGASYVAPRGVIGLADTLAGGNNAGGRYLDINLDGNDSAYYADFSTGMTFSVWAYPTGVQQYARMFTLVGSNVTSNPPHDIALGRNNLTNTLRYELRTATASAGTVDNVEGLQLNQWQHYTVTQSGTAVTLYRNGELVTGPQNIASAIITSPRRRGYLGRTSWNDSLFKGMLDEAVLSRTARSADWIKLSYATQLPGAAAVSNLVYPVTNANYSIGTAITANTPTVRGGAVTRYSVSPALPAGLSFNDTTGVISGTPTSLGSGTHTVTAWSGAWFTTATLNINVALGTENYSLWSQHRNLYINTAAPTMTSPPGAGVAGNVLKFPLLVRLDSVNFGTGFAQSIDRGADLRFTKAGDVVRLPHQIERWDSAARKADVWVLVDTVRGNLHNQLIRMHWGRASVPNASSGSEVFSSANGFAAVWHMNDSTSQMDASGNGNTATPSATSPTHNANSLIGAGKTFNGTNNWYLVGTDASAINLNTSTGPYTISGWANPTSCAARISIFAKYTNSNTVAGGRQYALHTSNSTDTWRFTNAAAALSTVEGGGEFAADAPSTCIEGAWTHVVGTYSTNGHAPTVSDTTAAKAVIYVNGAFGGEGVQASVTNTSMGNTALTYIGRIASNERYMNGSIDEITVSTVRRDTNWIKLSYATQRAGANIVVHNTAPVSVGQVAARLDGPALMVKQMGRGLMFQVHSEKAGTARVSLVDMWGRTVWSHTTAASEGLNSVTWNGRGNNGKSVASGVYVLQVTLTDAVGESVRTLRQSVPFTP
jgi:hypothetical protein